uniref:Deleted in malignant brain tumors 1 protein-like n=1 Tax=Oryzias melastigma TaxID=30732 RepID=A0A3B3CH19_ORYME
MKLLKAVFLLQLSYLCQGKLLILCTDSSFFNVLISCSKGDPYVAQIGAKCNWTLRMDENRSLETVGLDSDFADTLVRQICQDLGCGDVYYVNKSSVLHNITCLQQCDYKDLQLQNCSEMAESSCSVINKVVCGHQLLRLAGGPDRCAGRVEVWRDGTWGTVCDDQWDLRDADVVCAQHGCGYALSVTGQGGQFAPGRGPVHLDELNCTGREENLWDCPAVKDENDCGHKEDAGVICSEMRAIRLTGGLDRCSGKVEIHRNGSWGTLCDNCWTEKVATMVCSMLQCGGGAKPEKYSRFAPFTHNNGTPKYFYVCPTMATSLWQCKELYNNRFVCVGSHTSGVICSGSLGLPSPNTSSDMEMTSWTTGDLFSFVEILSILSLFVLLFVFLIVNTILCCLYKRRHVLLLKEIRSNPRSPTEHPQNRHKEAVNLIKVTTNQQHTDAPSSPRYIWTQLSSVNSTSVETDYEQYDPGFDPSVSLSTFRSEPHSIIFPLCSFRYLHFAVGDALFSALAAFCTSQYARMSKMSEDSFDCSSTSSGECYENIGNPNPGQYDDDYSPVSPD